ncbi:MAG TPA: Ppx/GppA phosphatase family protein [Tepidisphaeraceae bacterium]|jgi:exopolyphosphatase/guanosine-5'-triphosphate,3'-diphosphate pyrophosphatase
MSLASLATARRHFPAVAGRDSLRLAAIDVGSNSIHMVVAQIDSDGAVTTLWRMKEMVGLGRISFPSHRLSRDAMDRAILVLGRFYQAAQQRQCEKILTVATSAIREAHNGGDFIRRVKRELKMYVRVISAREEARLIYQAVRHAVPLGRRPHLIVDIGGGSVEFIVGDDRGTALLESRKLGAARMTAKFVHSDPINKEDRGKLLRHYEMELTPLCQSIADLHPVKAIGTSGTLENLAAMCGTEVHTNGEAAPAVIERGRFEKLLGKLLAMKAKDRANLRGLDEQRQEQIVAGALLVNEIFQRLNLNNIQICAPALREGILLDYLERHIPDLEIRRQVPDPRRRSVIDLARRCDWHQTHSEHVAHIAGQLFDELKSLHGMGTLERELLEYAAMLHDIGWHIGGRGHHKHSLYLILHGRLKNFSAEEIAIIANLARYHRKALPKTAHAAYAALAAPAQRVVDKAGALLRIADGLDRSHCSVIQRVRCKTGSRKVRCALIARSDAELELWAARQKRALFDRALGRAINFEIARR